MTREYWNSIADADTTAWKEVTLTVKGAKESPCTSCGSSPCCTYLPLMTFEINSLLEWDHADYLLNFDRIELGVNAAGQWNVSYAFPCRHLDRETSLCGVYQTDEQPLICSSYNPFNCFYRGAYSGDPSTEYIRIDRARFDFVADHVRFNDDRTLAEVPPWDELLAMMGAFDDQPVDHDREPALRDPLIDEWVVGIGLDREDPQPVAVGMQDVQNPCDGCAAPCCTTLVFPQTMPMHLTNFDFLTFSLGFPDVEVLVTSGGAWSIVVKTTCSHLVDGRCSIFGQPERPLLCAFYDEWKCDYKAQFTQARPERSMRLRLEELRAMLSTLPFDEDGNLLDMPTFDDLRSLTETALANSR